MFEKAAYSQGRRHKHLRWFHDSSVKVQEYSTTFVHHDLIKSLGDKVSRLSVPFRRSVASLKLLFAALVLFLKDLEIYQAMSQFQS